MSDDCFLCASEELLLEHLAFLRVSHKREGEVAVRALALAANCRVDEKKLAQRVAALAAKGPAAVAERLEVEPPEDPPPAPAGVPKLLLTTILADARKRGELGRNARRWLDEHLGEMTPEQRAAVQNFLAGLPPREE